MFFATYLFVFDLYLFGRLVERGQRREKTAEKGGVEFRGKDMRQNRPVFSQYALSAAKNYYVGREFLSDKQH